VSPGVCGEREGEGKRKERVGEGGNEGARRGGRAKASHPMGLMARFSSLSVMFLYNFWVR